MVRRLSSLRRDRRGAVTIIAAGSLMALLAATALAVDMGSIYLNARRLQGVADAAALASAEMPSGGTQPRRGRSPQTASPAPASRR